MAAYDQFKEGVLASLLEIHEISDAGLRDRVTNAWAMALAEALEEVVPDLGVDRDILLACGLCHDLGKPFEFSPSNQARWKQNPSASGFPALRHPVYGAHIALSAGLPEAVCHAAAAHSGEGELVLRSLENTIVHHADHAYWRILASAGKLENADS